MRIWWLSDYRRVGAEKAAVEGLVATEPWFKLSAWEISEYRFSALGEIFAHCVSYPIRLVYPDQFPFVPAWVEPQDHQAKWTSHQYGKGGTLCLELRPDNWSASATGADVLRSAYNLLNLENPLGDGEKGRAPSAHNIGGVQAYDWGREPLLIGAGCLERIGTGTAEAVLALRWMAADDVWPIYVNDAADRVSARRPPSNDMGTWRFDIPVVIRQAESPATTPADRAALVRAIASDVASEMLIPTGPAIVILIGTKEFTVYHTPDAAQVYQRKPVILPDESGARSGRGPDAAGKRIAIVGAGSVGSKLAESVLRSGIDKLMIVDGDVFLPGNLERHVLDWRDVGFRKVHGLKRRLLHIAPGAEIQAVAQNLNWQRSAKTYADKIEKIAGCDIIVDATGDPPTKLLLGALAAENGRAFVSVEVFEGGLGVLIARAVPGLDPAFESGRAAYLAWCDQTGCAPPASGRRTYEALTETGEPLVADDAAVTIAAGHAARVVLDIVDGRPEASGGWLLIGFRSEWVFNGHGHTINLDVGLPAPLVTNTEDPEVQAFVAALAKEALSAVKACS